MTTPQPEQTVDNILARLAWSGKYTDAGQEVVSAGEVSQAHAALNRRALATALRLIGDDEVRPADGPKRNGIEQGLRRTRNKLRQQLRQAFTDYYGGNDV